ncbi:MAG: chemotaxis protein CheA [Deltaproteobacteria bacterium]|nr:chemotaxis protein CheA [Deltaproteobacteria bacterium]
MSEDNNIPDLSELYGEFVSENKEILEKLSKELVSFENSPGDKDIINSLFRLAHTLKGNAGFIGLTALGDISHKIENVLESLREGTLPFFPEIIDTFFDSLDLANRLLEDFISGSEEAGDISGIMSKLEKLLEGPPADFKEETAAAHVDEKDIPQQSEETAAGPEGRDSASMRVNTVRLDRMVNLVGELTAGRSRLLQISNELKNDGLSEIASYIDTIAAQLQDEVLGIRMVPVKDLFGRFYRLVRDTGRSLGKDVKLVTEGEETELDKSVIEFLYDPLVHLVRNCISHGIESEGERLKLGKSKSGTIILNAYHEHNSIYIEVRDDGNGLDVGKIKEKALEKGIVSAEDARNMNDDEAAKLIFFSGFTTASGVDSVSGRGVGMDVVKSNIEKIGGHVRLAWEEGLGTTITVRVPLTLAIVQLFLVREGMHIFGIPMSYVDETIMIPDESFEYVKGEKIYMLRHQPVPVVSLSDLFGMEKFSGLWEGTMNAVILNQMGVRAGLIIDEFMGKVETVIKPLGNFIERLASPPEGISGASILGSGELVLVLDVPALWKGL